MSVYIYTHRSYRDYWVRAFAGINMCRSSRARWCMPENKALRDCRKISLGWNCLWHFAACHIVSETEQVTRPKSSSHITAQKASMGLINVILLSPKSVPGHAGHAWFPILSPLFTREGLPPRGWRGDELCLGVHVPPGLGMAKLPRSNVQHSQINFPWLTI